MVGLRGFTLNPTLLVYVTAGSRDRQRRPTARRRERRLRKRLDAQTIERMVGEYVARATSADLARHYGIAKSSVLRLVREAGWRIRHLRFGKEEVARLAELYAAGTTQAQIAQQLGKAQARCGIAYIALDSQERASMRLVMFSATLSRARALPRSSPLKEAGGRCESGR